MKILVSALAAAGVLAIGSGAFAQDAMMKAKPMQIKLASLNNSGETGTATMMDGAKGLIVKLRMSGGDAAGPQAVHIHKGTCEKLDPKPAWGLTPIKDGSSETTIENVKLADLQKGAYAINTHKINDLATYQACGSISKAK